LKNKIAYQNLLPELRDAVARHADEPEACQLVRKTAATTGHEVLEAEHAVIQYVSTRDVDRDGEILVPDGAVLDEFRRAPQVLWGHDYTEPPIGRDEWIRSDGYGLLAKTVYAVEISPRAREVYALRNGGYLATSSVGFVPLEYADAGTREYRETVRKLSAAWETDVSDLERAKRIYTKWLLLEHSDVSVPANPNALTVAKAAGLAKGVIPYRDLGNAPIDAQWDAGAEVREATVDDLRLMCAWFDSAAPDLKGSYKLPHHRASGGHPAVWRGVAAAMAALLGAR